MSVNVKQGKKAIAVAAMAVVSAAIAATLIQLDPPVVVSTSDPANNAFKAKMGWISYKSDPTVAQYDVKAQLLVYADGPAGAQNIYDRPFDRQRRHMDADRQSPATVATPSSDDREPERAFSLSPTTSPTSMSRRSACVNAGKGADALLTWTSSDCGGSVAAENQHQPVPLTGPEPALHVPVVRHARSTAA